MKLFTFLFYLLHYHIHQRLLKGMERALLTLVSIVFKWQEHNIASFITINSKPSWALLIMPTSVLYFLPPIFERLKLRHIFMAPCSELLNHFHCQSHHLQFICHQTSNPQVIFLLHFKFSIVADLFRSLLQKLSSSYLFHASFAQTCRKAPGSSTCLFPASCPLYVVPRCFRSKLLAPNPIVSSLLVFLYSTRMISVTATRFIYTFIPHA